MTRDGWRMALLEAVRRADAGDPELLDLLTSVLLEQDQAKQELREIGFGYIGRPWRGVVEDIRRELA